MAVKRPSFQFYPGDWLRSTDLRSCTIAARGLWIDMICLMHEGADYGYLKVGSKVILPPNLARMVGATLPEVEGWLEELVSAGVVSVDEDGCYLCRRMIRDEQIRLSRAAGGSKGGNPSLVGANKSTDKVASKVNLNANHPATPSSASSSASAEEKYIPPPPREHSPQVVAEAGMGDAAFLSAPSEGFRKFWGAYPRKLAPNDARKV